MVISERVTRLDRRVKQFFKDVLCMGKREQNKREAIVFNKAKQKKRRAWENSFVNGWLSLFSSCYFHSVSACAPRLGNISFQQSTSEINIRWSFVYTREEAFTIPSGVLFILERRPIPFPVESSLQECFRQSQ